MRTIENGRNFAWVVIDMGRPFSDMPRILRVDGEEISKGERDLCNSFRISSSYVTRLFREHLGMSFRRRLNLHGAKKAKDLLKTTDQTVDYIAKDCGFTNHTRLTEAFYRCEGMPPGQFRRSDSVF